MSSFQISYFILVSLIFSSVFGFYSHLRVSFPFERCAFVCHAERKKTVSGRLNRYLIEGNRRIEFLLFMLLYSCLIHSLLWKDMNLFLFFSIVYLFILICNNSLWAMRFCLSRGKGENGVRGRQNWSLYSFS